MERDMDIIDEIVLRIRRTPAEYLNIMTMRGAGADIIKTEPSTWVVPNDEYSKIAKHLRLLEEAGYATGYEHLWRLTWHGHEYADQLMQNSAT